MTVPSATSRTNEAAERLHCLLIPRPIQHNGHAHWTWAEASRCLYTSHPSAQGRLINGPDNGGIDVGPLIAEMTTEEDARYVVELVNAKWRAGERTARLSEQMDQWAARLDARFKRANSGEGCWNCGCSNAQYVRTFSERQAAAATPSLDGRNAADWHRYLHAEGILVADEGEECGPWHHRVFLNGPAARLDEGSATPDQAETADEPDLDPTGEWESRIWTEHAEAGS